ncbi:DUF1853 family protein [Simiduia agarivorans]|nr:DUF1853 family protein [Simiduia agarivorans]
MRDLHWCRTSEPLVGQRPCASPTSDEALIARVEAIWRQRTSHRLGHYYEMLWQVLIESHQSTTLLACDFQLNRQGKTLGALDFLLWDSASKRYTHLEVAIKFYLLAGSASNPMDWIGPNAKDRLGRKLDHMRHAQSRLLAHADTRALLNQDLITPPYPALTQDNLDARIMMQGWLFTPALNAQPHHHTHTGHWCRLSELAALAAQLPEQLLWLPKFYWIAGAPETKFDAAGHAKGKIPETPVVIDKSSIADWHRAHPRAHLYEYSTASGQQRLFIVPDSWPELEGY